MSTRLLAGCLVALALAAVWTPRTQDALSDQALARLMGGAPKQLYCCTCDECRTAVNCSDDSPNCNAGNCWSVCPNIPTQKEVWNAQKCGSTVMGDGYCTQQQNVKQMCRREARNDCICCTDFGNPPVYSCNLTGPTWTYYYVFPPTGVNCSTEAIMPGDNRWTTLSSCTVP